MPIIDCLYQASWKLPWLVKNSKFKAGLVSARVLFNFLMGFEFFSFVVNMSTLHKLNMTQHGSQQNFPLFVLCNLSSIAKQFRCLKHEADSTSSSKFFYFLLDYDIWKIYACDKLGT